MDSIVAILQKISELHVSEAILAGIAVGLEFVLRIFKSEKPLGLIHGVSLVLKKVAGLVAVLGSAVAKLAELTDKVLPQRVKE